VKIAKNSPQGQMIAKGLRTAQAVRRVASDPKKALRPPEIHSDDVFNLAALYEFHADGDVLLKADGSTYLWVRDGRGTLGGNWVHSSAVELE